MLRWIPKSQSALWVPRVSKEFSRKACTARSAQKRSTPQLNRFNKPISSAEDWKACPSTLTEHPQYLHSSWRILDSITDLCSYALQTYRFKISAAPAQQAPKTSSAMATPVTCKLDYLFGCLQTLHIHRTRRRHRAVQSKNLRSFPFRAKSHKKIEQFVQITNACGLEDGRNYIHSNGVLSFWVMGTAAQWQDVGYLPSCSCKKCHCLALLQRLRALGAMWYAVWLAWLVATTTLPSGNASATCDEYLNCQLHRLFEKNSSSTSLWTRIVRSLLLSRWWLLVGHQATCRITAQVEHSDSCTSDKAVKIKLVTSQSFCMINQ